MGYAYGTFTAATLRFADITNARGRRVHIGCIMSAGLDWVEVSLPDHLQVEDEVWVAFPPCQIKHRVKADWRTLDRIGFIYLEGGPAEEQFAGIPGLLDPRSAFLKRPNVKEGSLMSVEPRAETRFPSIDPSWS